jgi:hypothetical protein
MMFGAGYRIPAAIRSRSGHGAQVAPQAVAAAAWKQAVDLGMGAPPDLNRTREQGAAGAREFEPPAASVVGVDHDRDEAAPLQQLERGG